MPDLEKYKLSPGQSREIYEKQVKLFVFNGVEGGKEKPQLVIVGGQPAAGKSAILNQTLGQMPDAVIINGDDFRRFHPHEKALYTEFGAESSKYTHDEIAKWSVQSMKDAAEGRYNIVLENTLRSDTICNTIKMAEEAGYDVKVKVTAVNELNSQAGIYQRYEDQLEAYQVAPGTIPRFTPMEWHDEAYKGVQTTIDRIEKEGLCPVEVYSREGQRLYPDPDNREDLTAAQALSEARNAAWDIEQCQGYIMQNTGLMEQMAARGDENGVQTIASLNDKAEARLSADDQLIYSRILALQAAPANKVLGKNPHSKDLYNQYAKKDMEKNKGVWSKDTDSRITKKMFMDGLRPQAIQGALHHSPGMAKFGIAAEKSKQITDIVENARKSTEKLQQDNQVKKGPTLKLPQK